MKRFFKRHGFWLFTMGFLVAVLVIYGSAKAVKATGTDEFCNSCHKVHPHATVSWKRSTHYDNKRGIVVHCVECHLPPEGLPKFTEKVKTGLRDVYGVLFKDVEKINWEAKSQPDYAARHTYKASCVACHKNLFPLGLSVKGEDAHLYYSKNEDKLHCINCHIAVGHYSETAIHAHNVEFGKKPAEQGEIYTTSANPVGFESFTETVPGTSIAFRMLAIPGGSFSMGSPENEAFRRSDEGPVRTVELSSFYMAEAEVSWDEFLAFFAETASEGRVETPVARDGKVDGISGPTPPWGAPDQGWGKGKRPAITMSHYAARVYCEWLSMKTGKKYRLPTEAEWEYAARAGSEGPYFFGGDVKRYTSEGWKNKLFGADTSIISSHAIYNLNSEGRTALPESVRPNAFGLRNMLGNVAEFCSDFYAEDAYSALGGKDPAGPETGEEYVIRGGTYRDDAANIRAAARDYTRTTEWLKTDPQMPKSKWWYSDQVWVGFRVVCEVP